jgi:hypothetical protein
MPSDKYCPRFIFEISEEQKARTNKLLGQFGIRKAIFSPILDDVLDMIERHGDKFVGAIVSGMVKPREVISSLGKASKTAEGIENVESQ